MKSGPFCQSGPLSRAERLLVELIALPSVNPAFLPPNDPRAGEAHIAGYLAAVAARSGLDVEMQDIQPGRSNLIVRLTPQGKLRQRVLLAPHLDTVGEPGLDALLHPRVSDLRIHGRGACDTKGSVAAMLTALLNVAEHASRPSSTEIIFAGLIDEEKGQAGSRALAGWGWEADLAIVGEPTRNRVVTAHKGDVWLHIETQGRAAHGSTPEKGINAVRSMAQIVTLLEGEYAQSLRARSHPLLGHPTVNVGTIAGGHQPNIVPAQCCISIDRRTLPGETDETIRKEIQRWLKRAGLACDIHDLREARCPALETDPHHPAVQRLLTAARQHRQVGVHYFCDAAILAMSGFPSVIYGPGDIAQAHTSNEWIGRRSLAQAVKVLTDFLGSFD